MIIQKATYADLSMLSKLWKSDLQASWTMEMIGETFNLSETYTRVAHDHKRDTPFVGFVMGSFLGDVAEIYAIAVAEGSKGTGVGKALLLGFLEEAKSRNVHSIFLEVAETNKRALSFYEKYGFERLSIRKNYYSQAQAKNSPIFVDAVVLRKVL